MHRDSMAAAAERPQIGVRAGRVRALRAAAGDLLAAASRSRVDIAVVTSITLLAAVLRIWHLGSVPLGLHGDEAWTGLDARRVLHEGYIGPYLPSAVGQPIGPLYLTALLLKFMPETTFTLRFSMALFGIATIPLAYCAFATMFNRTVAAFAALMLAIMMWHLHLSRTGFMVAAWPCVEMAVLLALWHAIRCRRAGLFVLAGALTGLGVYSYNAYILFVPVPFVAMVWTYWPGRRLRVARSTVAFLLVFTGAGLIATVPMFVYIANHTELYRFHQKLVGVTYTPEWKDAGVSGKSELLWDRATEWERGLVFGDRADLGDGLASPGHPVIDPVTRFLAALGACVAVWNWRRPAYAAVLSALALLPLGALLTIGDGLYRRTFGLTPFIALLAAIPLAWVWRVIVEQPARRRYPLAALCLAVPAFAGVTTTRAYFGPIQDSAVTRFVYPYEIDAASRYMSTLPAGTHVYLYSFRWGFRYETRRFLAPNVTGEDRSLEFREDTLSAAPIDHSISRGRSQVAFVFLEPYLDDLEVVTRHYPGGTVTEGTRGDQVLFRAYSLAVPVVMAP
jgi:4-amino-4-deoxy-L-arabinose transferase-like glycosyltransferase